MTHTISVTDKAGSRFGRYVTCERSEDLLSHVSRVLAEFDGTSSVVVSTGPDHHFEMQPVTFTNVCGKINHRTAPYVVRDELLPLLVHVTNSFGTFKALYSPLCNLTICHVGNCTLFRGARSCLDVRHVASHALRTNCVTDAFLHMLVASSRVGKPVSGSNFRLKHVLCSDPRWSARTREETEDKAYQCCFELSGFDEQWLGVLLQGRARAPTKLLLNINRKGSVNYFLSLVPSTKMKCFDHDGVDEQVFKPVCEFFHSLIEAHS